MTTAEAAAVELAARAQRRRGLRRTTRGCHGKG
jgi:hypothetical protein